MNSETKKRWLVVTLFIAPLFFMSLGWVAFYSGWSPQGRTNRGEFLNPIIELTSLGLTKVGNSTESANAKKTWQLITLDDGACEKACQQAVYYTRQINVALGKNKERMQHAYWTSNALDAATQTLFKADPELHVFHIDIKAWLKNQSATFDAQKAFDNHYIFIVDPLGNMIMYYTPDKNPHDILDDLNKTLLKYSSVG
jgi:hypothetical protein